MKLFLCLTKLLFTLFLVHAIPMHNFKKDSRVWFPINADGVMVAIKDFKDALKTYLQFIPAKDIRFLLYTKKNPKNYKEIRLKDFDSLRKSKINPVNPVVLTIHGWTGGPLSASNVKIRDAYLSVSDVNMITVDWEKGARQNYFQSVHNVLAAGPKVAEFLDWLNEVIHVPFSKMHIIGHSLGGQMAGIVGRHCTRGLVGRITGLDPAHVLWGLFSQRIRKTDGEYVEIIHTNAGVLGMRDAVGHNDFYPNGGLFMPGCPKYDIISCSHSMCIEYMAESIISGGFTAVHCAKIVDAFAEKCSGCLTMEMGGSDIKSKNGIFSLRTNPIPPYS